MKFTWADLILITMIVLMAAAIAAFAPAGNQVREAQFYADNTLVKTIAIGHSSGEFQQYVDIKSKEGQVRFLIEKDRVSAVSADCPNKICVRTGWIDKPGRQIICAPSKIYVVLRGSSSENIDTRLR